MTTLIAIAACSAGLTATTIACLLTLMLESVQGRIATATPSAIIDGRLVATANATS